MLWVTRSVFDCCILSNAFLPSLWLATVDFSCRNRRSRSSRRRRGRFTTDPSRSVDNGLSCTLLTTKASKKLKFTNKTDEAVPMIFWPNPEEEGEMRLASRLFRRNFLFALIYTLLSSEQMIRSVWHDLNSTWPFFKEMIIQFFCNSQNPHWLGTNGLESETMIDLGRPPKKNLASGDDKEADTT